MQEKSAYIITLVCLCNRRFSPFIADEGDLRAQNSGDQRRIPHGVAMVPSWSHRGCAGSHTGEFIGLGGMAWLVSVLCSVLFRLQFLAFEFQYEMRMRREIAIRASYAAPRADSCVRGYQAEPLQMEIYQGDSEKKNAQRLARGRLAPGSAKASKSLPILAEIKNKGIGWSKKFH
jgi:hypothetical protein